MARKKALDPMQLAVELEKSRLNREKSLLLLDKALLLYMFFLLVGVVGFVNELFDLTKLNAVVILGFGVLGLGIVPYALTMHRETDHLNALLRRLHGKSGGKRK